MSGFFLIDSLAFVMTFLNHGLSDGWVLFVRVSLEVDCNMLFVINACSNDFKGLIFVTSMIDMKLQSKVSYNYIQSHCFLMTKIEYFYDCLMER